MTARPFTSRGERPAVAVGTGVVVLVALWRITLGAGLGDDAHVIGLAVRMAHGDLPFADEMNVQALGSVWAVPFTWLWTHVVGLDGLVLASRALYVAFALGAGALAYRALRVSFRPVVAATAVAVPLLAPPYNLFDLGYNTAPIAFGVVAACAAHAALAVPGTPSGRRWALVAGGAAAAAVFSNPLTAVAGVVLLVTAIVLARRRDVAVPLLAGVAAVTVPALVLFAVVGVDAIGETLRYASGYRATGVTLLDRLDAQVTQYRFYVWRPRFLPAAGLALLAAVPRLPPRLRALALAGAAGAVVVPSFLAFRTRGQLGRVGSRPAMGTVPAVPLVLVLVFLAVPVVAWAVHRRRRDVGTLLLLGVPAGLAGLPVIAAGTLSAPVWGAAMVGAAPAVTAVVAGWAVMGTGAWRPLGRLACAGLVAAVLALLVLTPYRDPVPWRLDARIGSGAFAGVLTTRTQARAVHSVQDAATRWLRPGDGVLFYGVPGGYVLVDARADTNLEWMGEYGAANRATLDWFARTGRVPRVVVVDQAVARMPGGLTRIARTDPLVAYVLQDYHVVEAGVNRPTVLVRD